MSTTSKDGRGDQIDVGDDSEITGGSLEEASTCSPEQNEAARLACQVQAPRDHVAQVPASIGAEGLED